MAEVLPVRFRHRAAPQRRERLLVQATRDAESFNNCHFALSALSHLRRVTAVVAEALLAAIRDVSRVQQNALAVAERFRVAEGDILSALVAALRDESAVTTYAAGQVPAALARGAAQPMTIARPWPQRSALMTVVLPMPGRPVTTMPGPFASLNIDD